MKVSAFLHRHRNQSSRRGSGIVLAALMIVILGGLATALVAFTGSGYLEQRHSRDEMRSFYVAEAGLSEAFASLRANGIDALADYVDPQPYGKGTFEVAVTDGFDDPVLRFDRVRLVSLGAEGRERSRVLMVARRIPNGSHLHGVFGADGVTIESNSFIDSFNSMYGPYVPGADHVSEYGSVGSNADITVEANVEIHGDVSPGPDGILDDNAPQTLITGSTEPADDLVEMPPIVVPPSPPTGPLNIAGPMVLTAGSHHFTSLTATSGSSLVIEGPSVVVVDSLVESSNAEILIDATSGPVTIYGTGDFDLRSNSIFRSIGSKARDVSIFLTTDTSDPTKTVALNSNADFFGTIYAPNALLTVESNFRVFGAIKAQDIVLASNSQVHFDEDLLFDDFEGAEFEQVSWRPVSENEDL